jgi:putative phage-type endonuclease
MIEQGTPEWFAQRMGKVTASRVADIMAKTKTGVSASRGNYLAQLVAERLTGQSADTFKSGAMQHGTETEPQARMVYEAETGQIVGEVAMITHPTIEMSGASPDGLVGEDGLVEIKCPNTSTHIATLLADKAPSGYMAQMQWQMACTGRAWCDFVSFDPRMPTGLQLFVTRIKRDDKLIGEIEREVEAFLAELDAMVEELKNMKVAA